MNDNVIIEKDLFALGTDRVADYIAHVYCDGGACEFVFNEKPFAIHAGDCAIFTITKLVYDVRPSDDFLVTVVYVHNTFLAQSAPDSNYSVKGVMLLFQNPVIWLDKAHQRVCKQDFLMVEHRFNDSGHHFYNEALSSALRSLFLDYFDFHVRMDSGEKDFSMTQSELATRFIRMLEGGMYKTHRDLAYYAGKLCVSTKYLSEVMKAVSGFPATYWINRFTIVDIQRCLKDPSLTLTQITDDFNFSSQAHFSHYVLKHLGKSPSQFREK
jgi:AraC-like DNA-binding protein